MAKFPLVILGTAHRRREPGKCSPDLSFYEYQFSRQVCRQVSAELTGVGLRNVIDIEDDDLPVSLQSPSYTEERARELSTRVGIVNRLADQEGGNCLYVSIHVNADGLGQSWTLADGWQASVCPRASQKSREIAAALARSAQFYGLKLRQQVASRLYWVQGLYVLQKTSCPAVLTENLFMTNRVDLAFLKRECGFQRIVDVHVKAITDYIYQSY